MELEKAIKAELEAAPPHMDKAARNKRLYEFLKQLGLFVDPVYGDTAMRRIDYLKVSAGTPN